MKKWLTIACLFIISINLVSQEINYFEIAKNKIKIPELKDEFYCGLGYIIVGNPEQYPIKLNTEIKYYRNTSSEKKKKFIVTETKEFLIIKFLKEFIVPFGERIFYINNQSFFPRNKPRILIPIILVQDTIKLKRVIYNLEGL